MRQAHSADQTLRKSTIGGVIGNVLEWYDFAVFGYFAPVIGAQFFPSEDLLASTLKAFGVFAVGYLMRPLGGLLFGHIGDRLGRKKALELSVLMMAIPTTLLGLLPTHAQIGAAAPLLVVTLRLVQGLSVGGEYVGSISYMTEIGPAHRRGLWGSLTSCTVNGGILLGSAVATLVHSFLDAAELEQWGWRIPFLLGILLGLFGLWLRHGLVETELFERMKRMGRIERSPILEAFRSGGGSIFRLIPLLMLFGGGFYALFVWWPTYLTKFVTPPVPHALLANTLSILVLSGFTPLAGLLSDMLGRRSVLISAMIVIGVSAYPLTAWTDHGSFPQALISQIIFAVGMAGCLGPMAATMAEMFPTRHRYTSIAIAYNITVGVVGGTAPLLCTWLTSCTGDLAAPAYYVIVLALISLAAALGMKPTSGGALE